MFKFIQVSLIISNLIFIQSTVSAESIKPYLKLDSFLYSEATSIEDTLNNKQGSYRRNGKKLIGSIWLETGIRKGAWSASSLYREEHHYTFLPDTADLYNSINASHKLDAGRRYEIDLEVERFNAKGLRIAYQFGKNRNFKFQLGGSYFEAEKLLSGNLVGYAVANSSNDYDYDINVNYAYNRELLFGRGEVKAPDGNGFAIDMNGKLNISNRLTLSVNIKDLVGRIYWKEVPATIATVTSGVKTTDDDGFVIINPNIQGVHSTLSRYTQILKPSGNLTLNYSLKEQNTGLLVKTRFISNKSFFAIGAERVFKKGVLTSSIWPQLGAIDLGYKNRNIGISIGVDNISLNKNNVFWLSFELN